MSTAKALTRVLVAAHAPAITKLISPEIKKTDQSSVFFICACFICGTVVPRLSAICNYLPRKYEMTAPKNPNKPRLRINSPAGIFVADVLGTSLNVGGSRGGGGVNVGKRVGVCRPIKAAARVGSIVGVENGVGVGGISTSGSIAPGESLTYGPYTQPVELGTPS